MSNFVALVVEDDPLQREVVSGLLRDNGLEVIECCTAEAAEVVLASAGNDLLALVTDVNLAGQMTGVELAQYAKRKFPGLNVVVVSGIGPLTSRRALASSRNPISLVSYSTPCLTEFARKVRINLPSGLKNLAEVN